MSAERLTLFEYLNEYNPVRYEAVDADNTVVDSMTAPELREQSLRLAAALREVAEPGDRVVIPPLSGLDFERAFFACVAAGMIAVPLPKMPSVASNKLRRVESILADCDARVIVSPPDEVALVAERTGVRALDPAVARQPAGDDGPGPAEPVARDPHDIVLLQYTSGSTGDPKGVEISQANLVINQREMGSRCDVTASTDIVAWLPSYHDMGLCSMVIQPVVTGARVVKIHTTDFIRRPLLWLEAISGRGEVWSAAPDFAYRTCLQALERAESFDADLSGWRTAGNASEPVRESTMVAFEKAMAPYGFRSTAFRPGYGLAESTVCVAVNAPVQARTVLSVDLAQLAQGVVVPVEPASGRAPLVGCGRPIDDSDVVILALDDAVVLGEDRVGELAVAGRSNARGYWKKPEVSEATFGTRIDGRSYLRTGDIAFLHDGEVFICDRLKDLIIAGGENYFPSDLEADVTARVAELDGTTVAVFQDAGGDVVFAFEAASSASAGDLEALIKSVVRAAAQTYPGRLRGVALRRGLIPKTTSGKVQRTRCRDLLATGSITPLHTWPERG
ncbi:fatty acyl-AMP ligase [Myceligenerans crystallogenes]|uniref:AMP-dependent synthetase/ligase domain-containing protein n=1 Tax=Myceligenerans crystallogenes TaxID=316335 RepID=A0ABP4ZIH3_9MICO